MATWTDLVNYVHNEYKIIDSQPDEVRILVEYGDEDELERSQVVMICREVLDDREDWVQIASVCGPVANVDLHKLLVDMGETTVVCGAIVMNDHVVIRDALPLENLDLNEFVDPLTFVAATADHLEETFWGGDGY